MDANEHTLGPSELCDLIGTSSDVLRDRRRRGLIKKYGVVSETGRWRYSIADALGMFAAQEIAILGFDLETAFEVGSDCITPLAKRIAGIDRDGDRFVMLWSDRRLVGIAPVSENIRTKYAASVVLSEGIPNAVGITTLDMHEMARQAPDALVEAVRRSVSKSEATG